MSSSREYKYKFSFVMPVYNVEQYLSETIESVLAQDIGFKENIQLILVNDGSNDGSSKVAKHYLNKYPENIIYVEQENKGVSAARNAGIELVEGKYISFLDSDDLLSPDTIREVYGFFEQHYKEVDLASIKLEFFEAKSGAHPLNYKYETTKVIDINENHKYIQLSGGSVFVKTEAVQHKHKFDPRLQMGEDTKFVTELILDKLAYGVIAGPTYYYRKRLSLDSATGSALKNRRWYLDTLKYVHQHIFDYASYKLGYVPEYIQFLIMYDLQWRFLQAGANDIPKDINLNTYNQTLISLLQYIDDDIILSQEGIHIEHKLFIIRKKYGDEKFNKLLKYIGTKYYINNTFIYDNMWRHQVLVDKIDIKNKVVKIQGTVSGIILPDSQFGFSVGGIFYPVKPAPLQEESKLFLNETVYDKNRFIVEFPLKNNNEHVKPLLRRENWKKQLTIEGNRYSRLFPLKANSTAFSLYKDHILCCVNPSLLVFVRRTSYRILIKELKYLATLSKLWFKKNMSLVRRSTFYGNREHVGKANVENEAIFSIILLRLIYWLTKPFVNKKIWLISDELETAGDNGEAFFRFVVTQTSNGIKPLFVLTKTSSDYDRVSQIGTIVDPTKWWYKLLFLHADKIISSSSDHSAFEVFGEKQKLIRDIIDFDFIFLQQAIPNRQASWLDVYKRNIKLLVTASDMEYKSLLSYDNSQNKNYIVLTGFPYYDFLENSQKKKTEKEYLERFETFFKYTDKHNSRRVYQAILNLDEAAYIDSVVRHHKNQSRGSNTPIPTYWWRYNYPVELNFGDEITPYIMKSIWGLNTVWAGVNDAALAGAGSILNILEDKRKKDGLNVWGSGYIEEGKKNHNQNLIFHAVRGPRTLSRINTKVAQGDPGILASLVFSGAKEKKYKVGVVPHYVDVDNKALSVIKENPNYLIIDVLQPPDKVAFDISSCHYVISSSLHGLIFADSFGIPNNRMRLSDKVIGGDYKFNDYYESTARRLVEVDTSILGDESKINKAMENYVPVADLKSIQEDLINSFPFKGGLK